MNFDLAISWLRAFLLLGLLGFFAFNLVTGLLKGHPNDEFNGIKIGWGQDPGVRVLLQNRSGPPLGKDQPPEPSRLFEAVDITILQTVDVITPNDPDNLERRVTLRSGAKLIALPDATDGIVLASKDWGAGGKELRWAVTHVYIEPQATNPSATPAEAKVGPGRRDPTKFEAANGDAVFTIQGRRYRGSLDLMWASPKELVAINCVPLEAYVDGVVAVEMSPSYPLEALKAQAIASRSYAFTHEWLAHTARQAFDVIDGEDDQDYRGTGNGTGLVTRAVVDTRGIVTHTDLSHGNYPFAPLFSASSGGFSENINHVFPDARDARGHPITSDVMPAQGDVYCRPGAESLGNTSTHWQTTVVIKPADIRAALTRLYKRSGDPRLSQVGYIKDLRVGMRDPKSNRVESVLISHTQGEPIELNAHLFRMMIGPGLIHSTLWTSESPKKIDSADGRTKDYQISCLGWGHGVGMSQISAVEMARQGLSAPAILGYFYPRAILRQLW
jgi:peptidoglycan hydrolase-like amidase